MVDDKITVGAHYYPWFGRGDHVDWTNESPEEPVLGSYDARDAEVIEKHLNWCQEYGIDWLSVSWWGQGGAEDITLRDHLLEGPIGDTEFSIFYETTGVLDSYDMGGEGGDQLVSDIEYLADTYFDHPNYRHIDGRPVIYLYVTGMFEGDIAGAYQRMRDAVPGGLYIISDLIRHGPPLDRHMDALEVSDAITSYTMYTPDEARHADFANNVTDVYDDWMEPISQHNKEFIPVALPGYDDTEIQHVNRDNPPLEASPELLRELCEKSKPYITEEANSLFITSFNEWYENTQIEPSQRYGTQYLEVVQDVFGSETSEETENVPTASVSIMLNKLEFDTGNIHVSVTDSNQSAIENANITISGPSEHTKTTDASGVVVFEGVEIADWSVNASKDGYEGYSIPVTSSDFN